MSYYIKNTTLYINLNDKLLDLELNRYYSYNVYSIITKIIIINNSSFTFENHNYPCFNHFLLYNKTYLKDFFSKFRKLKEIELDNVIIPDDLMPDDNQNVYYHLYVIYF